MKKIRHWFIENGFMGFLAIVIAICAAFLGTWFVFWGSIGFFIGKNWEIIRKLWKEKYKEEVEDFIDDLKDDIKEKIS